MSNEGDDVIANAQVEAARRAVARGVGSGEPFAFVAPTREAMHEASLAIIEHGWIPRYLGRGPVGWRVEAYRQRA